jgi:flagellar motility protein MotE (MotC chaperone)
VKKLFATVLVLNLLAALGLVGFLFATGRVDKEKTLTILDLLKHPGSPKGLREHTYEVLTKATPDDAATQPGTQPGTAPANPGRAVDRLETAGLTYESQRLELENKARELRHQQDLLESLQADVQTKLARIESERKTFESEVQKVAAKTHKAGFDQSLTLYNELKPKQIKDIFLTLPAGGRADLVAEFLLAMESDKAGKIVAEFKTPDEKAFITDVLEKIRTASPGGAPAASTMPAPPAPAAVAARS